MHGAVAWLGKGCREPGGWPVVPGGAQQPWEASHLDWGCHILGAGSVTLRRRKESGDGNFVSCPK